MIIKIEKHGFHVVIRRREIKAFLFHIGSILDGNINGHNGVLLLAGKTNTNHECVPFPIKGLLSHEAVDEKLVYQFHCYVYFLSSRKIKKLAIMNNNRQAVGL
jgi:hypothetical protein